MKKFKIKVFKHCIKGNRIAEQGDIVNEDQLTGPAFELVKQGFIEEVEVNEVEVIAEAEIEPETEITEVVEEVEVKAPKAKAAAKK